MPFLPLAVACHDFRKVITFYRMDDDQTSLLNARKVINLKMCLIRDVDFRFVNL